MLFRILVFFAMLLLGASAAMAQNRLMFRKKSHRIVYYYAGDMLSFNIRNHSGKITDRILRFEDGLIIFRLYKVNPREITHVYVDGKTKQWYFLRYKYEKLLPIMGGGYILLDWINTGQITGSTAIIGSSMIGAGLIARAVISRRMKIKGKRKLALIK